MNLSKYRNRAVKVATNLLASSVTVFLLLVSTVCVSEDIELYISETAQQTKARPNVLIIFDNSGSMNNNGDEFKKLYDPNIIYPAVGGLNSLSDKFVYFTKGGIDGASLPVPDGPNETRRFLDDINSCQVARDILDQYGYYSGQIKEYALQGNSGSWQEIPDNNGANIDVIDCEADVLALNPNNAGILKKTGNTTAVIALPDGYPIDGLGTKKSPIYYTAEAANSNVSWSGQLVTLYTDNYLRWRQSTKDEIGTEYKTRLELAKESVATLINTTPNVNFGLQVFNNNDNNAGKDGGRIVHGIQESTVNSRAELLSIIDNLQGDTWTPLCETLYEASRYFSGKSVDYGDDNDVTPKRDQDIEDTGVYKSPFSSCSNKVYVVLITDGAPSYDMDAVDKIFQLPATGQDSISVADRFTVGDASTPYEGQYSYLAGLAGWMNTNDLNLSLDGDQTAETYTIGFGEDAATDAAPLLVETAKRGGGEYFYAEDTASLTSALTNVLANITPSNDSLTSASVASNNFDRTETRDAVYYSMFQPSRGARWHGNIKKYKVVNGIQQGANDVVAINQSTGHFSEDVQSYWSSSKDGDAVSEGGVAEMLRKKANRVIYSDLGASNGLVELTFAKASNSSAYSSQTELATALDVIDDQGAIEASLSWINGKDPDDEDRDNITDENRDNVFGDPLHSKPVVINYGNDNIYIVVGTNHGVLHMFKDDDENNAVDETWAFMPKEFIANIEALRANFTTSGKVYGIDGLITAHIVDDNGNGIVDGNDKVWLFFGYRRGGTSYYAMDVTDPTDPSVMWTIEGGQGDFTELGQTWSQPKVAYSKLNVSGAEAKPVLIFGGGYAISKDSHAIGGTGGSPDNQGKAIYMVDAATGVLKWTLSASGDTTFNGTDSISASIATLDSDGDGLTDRLYAVDTGGNVWRVDMPGSDKSKFSVFKLAELGGDTTNAVDRRFFNEPSIVRAYITETIDSGKKDADNKAIIVQQDIPYDAVLIGSGDRSNPIGSDTSDVFFMIKDINIKTHQFTGESNPAIPTAITIGDLADYTNNPFGETLTSQEKETLSLAVSLKSGWLIALEQLGEKSTSAALVINNVVYFTTYTPPSLILNSTTCDLPNGQGWLYAVDLSLGVNKYNWQAEDSKNRDDRIAFISEQFLGAPTLIVTKKVKGDDNSDNSDNSDTEVLEPDGNIIVGRKIVPVGFKLQTLRTYLYITED